MPDANLVPVASTSDVIELMNIGHRNRVVGATALNDRSSRSHRFGDVTESLIWSDCSWLLLTPI